MGLDRQDTPQGLVADHLFPRGIQVAARPEVPRIAPVLLLGGEARISRLVAARLPAWACGVALLCAAWCFEARRQKHEAKEKKEEEAHGGTHANLRPASRSGRRRELS